MNSFRFWLSVLLMICLPLQSLALQTLPCAHAVQTHAASAMPCHQSAMTHMDMDTDSSCQNCTVCHLAFSYSPVIPFVLAQSLYHAEQNPTAAQHFYQHIPASLFKPPRFS